MRKILQFILKILAKLTLARYKPRIIGVTGSVGKTGSRLAIVAVLQERWRVGQGVKNFNNEIGLPLVVLGEPDSGYKNPIKWLGIFLRAIKNLIIKNQTYPEVLVLEYGVDRPGDMSYLLSIAKPQVAVVTAVAETHLEFFGSLEAVAKEKGKLISALNKGDVAVLNFDFPLVESMKAKTKLSVVSYGEKESVDVRLYGINISQDAESRVLGMSFRLSLGGSTVPVLIRDTVGKPVVSMAAAGAAVGKALGLSVLEITRGLEKFKPPAGRLRLLKGISGSLIIDDTYNSSPQAAREALDILAQIQISPGAHRWAVLGDMLELGQDSAQLHSVIGQRVAQLRINYLITVGQESKNILNAARTFMSESNSWQAENTAEAVKLIKAKVQSGDVILVKGSQGVRCERIVKELLADPEKASEILVRQSSSWLR